MRVSNSKMLEGRDKMSSSEYGKETITPHFKKR